MVDRPSHGGGAEMLQQPTRARLFALLGELGRPAGTVELAARLGLHPNGVRVHLERLRQEGLLVRSSDPRPRGRPRDSWRIAPDAQPSGSAPTAYADLGRWLARAIGSGARSLRGVEATGRTIGRELAHAGECAAAGPEAFQARLAELGFQPEANAADGPRELRVRLRNCPYCAAARENQPVVCSLHRGMTRGLLDELMPAARLARFDPNDPETAGCIIELERARARPTRTGT